MLIMPVVKGEAFNACWLDKSRSLHPNLNSEGDGGAISGRGRSGGDAAYSDSRIFRYVDHG